MNEPQAICEMRLKLWELCCPMPAKFAYTQVHNMTHFSYFSQWLMLIGSRSYHSRSTRIQNRP